MTRPLEGVRVVELGEGISAAYCSLMLAVLGADVIKIESRRGDETRRMGPFPDDRPDRERSALFLSLNRNKRSVAIDLDAATGQELLRQIASQSNLVVENFPPGYLDGRGIGYEALSRDHSELVVTSVTPFGQSGPYRDYAASEITLFALGGMMNLVGDASREPLMFGGKPALHSAGTYALAASMVALQQAELTGCGDHVDVSVMEGLASSHFQDLIEYEYVGVERRRTEVRMPIPTQDGFISFTVQAHQYGDFRRLILGEDAPQVAVDVVARDRQRLEGEMDTQILEWSVQRTKYDAYREAQEAHVPAAYLADVSDLLASPQYDARSFWTEIDHPDAGTLRYPGFAAQLDGVEWQWTRAPRLGEHTDELLRELTDLSEAEIGEVRAAGVLL